jgi:enterobacterial common antigen flippase
MNRVLRAALVMGASSLVTIGAGVARNKIAATLLGPEGIGTLGLLATGLLVISTALGLGLGQSGVRQVAHATVQETELESSDALTSTARALVLGTNALGVLAAVLILVLHQLLARLAQRDDWTTLLALWLAVGAWATIALTGRTALVNGLNRIRLLAQINAWGAVGGSAVGVVAVWVWRHDGLGAMIAAPPLVSWLVSVIATRELVPRATPNVRENRAPNVDPEREHRLGRVLLRDLWGPFVRMARLGVAISAGLLLSTATQFGVRVWLERTLSLEAAGQFQAAWNIANVYLGFALGAIAAEYYPRVSAMSDQPEQLNRAVTEELELIISLVLPIILLMIVLAPQITHLLYAPEFEPAVSVLRWQLTGDVAKVGVWTLGFLLLARESKRRFFYTELVWNIVYAIGVGLSVRTFGLTSSGWVYMIAYLVSLGLCLYFARLETGFRLGGSALRLIVIAFVLALATVLLVEMAGVWGWWLAVGLTIFSSLWGLARLRSLSGLSLSLRGAK